MFIVVAIGIVVVEVAIALSFFPHRYFIMLFPRTIDFHRIQTNHLKDQQPWPCQHFIWCSASNQVGLWDAVLCWDEWLWDLRVYVIVLAFAILSLWPIALHNFTRDTKLLCLEISEERRYRIVSILNRRKLTKRKDFRELKLEGCPYIHIHSD